MMKKKSLLNGVMILSENKERKEINDSVSTDNEQKKQEEIPHYEFTLGDTKNIEATVNSDNSEENIISDYSKKNNNVIVRGIENRHIKNHLEKFNDDYYEKPFFENFEEELFCLMILTLLDNIEIESEDGKQSTSDMNLFNKCLVLNSTIYIPYSRLSIRHDNKRNKPIVVTVPNYCFNVGFSRSQKHTNSIDPQTLLKNKKTNDFFVQNKKRFELLGYKKANDWSLLKEISKKFKGESLIEMLKFYKKCQNFYDDKSKDFDLLTYLNPDNFPNEHHKKLIVQLRKNKLFYKLKDLDKFISALEDYLNALYQYSISEFQDNDLEKKQKLVSSLEKKMAPQNKPDMSLVISEKLSALKQKLLSDNNNNKDALDFCEHLKAFFKNVYNMGHAGMNEPIKEQFKNLNERSEKVQPNNLSKTVSCQSLLFFHKSNVQKYYYDFDTDQGNHKTNHKKFKNLYATIQKVLLGLVCCICFYVPNVIVGFMLGPVPESYVDKYDFFMNNPYDITGIFFLQAFYFELFPLLSGLLGFLIALFIILTLKTDKRNQRKKGEEHGSSRWETDFNRIGLQDDENPGTNMIFSKNVKISWNPSVTQRNSNILIQGAPGTGKTRFFLTPCLMEGDYNFILTDPKGDLLGKTGEMFRKRGYKIKVLNLIQNEQDRLLNRFDSDGYNFFEYISSVEDITSVVQALIDLNVDPNASKSDPYWDTAAGDILRCIFTYLQFVQTDPDRRNPYEALKLARTISPQGDSPVGGMRECMQEIMDKRNQDPSSLTIYENYVLGIWDQIERIPEKTLGSVLSTLFTKMAKFDVPAVQKLTQKDELSLLDFAKKDKCILFIITSDADKSFNFLGSILYIQLFKLLYDKARELEGNRLPIHLQFFLDEFVNVGKIPDFISYLSTSRSRNIGFTIIIQSTAQVKDLYKDSGFNSIEGNCDYFMSLGVGNDLSGAKYLSEKLGVQTIELETVSKSTGQSKSVSTSKQVISRPLLQPDEVMRNKDLIIIVSKMFPIKDQRYDIKDHKDYASLSDGQNKVPLYKIIPVNKRLKDTNQIREKLDRLGMADDCLPYTKTSGEISSVELTENDKCIINQSFLNKLTEDLKKEKDKTQQEQLQKIKEDYLTSQEIDYFDSENIKDTEQDSPYNDDIIYTEAPEDSESNILENIFGVEALDEKE